MQSLTKTITALQHDVSQLHSEKDSLIHSLTNKRQEIDSYITRMSVLTEEQRVLMYQLDRVNHQNETLEKTLSTLRQERDEQQRQHEQYTRTLSGQFKDQIKDVQTQHTQAIEKIKSEYQTLLKQSDEKILTLEKQLSSSHYEEEWSALQSKRNNEDLEYERKRLQGIVEKQEEELKVLKERLEEKERVLKEERLESDASKLRMKVQDQQLADIQQELRLTKQQLASISKGGFGPSASSMKNQRPGAGGRGMFNTVLDTSIPDLSIDVPPSPMFSEDFNPGTISIPASPLVSFTPQLNQYYPNGNPQLPSVMEQPDSTHSDHSYFGQQQQQQVRQSLSHDPNQQRLLDENERLKNIIKEVSLSLSHC